MNIVRICISMATEDQQQHAMEIICTLNPKNLHRFCVGFHSNYVVQELMDVASAEQMHTFWTKIAPYFEQMQHYASGRRIIEKLNQFITYMYLIHDSM